MRKKWFISCLLLLALLSVRSVSFAAAENCAHNDRTFWAWYDSEQHYAFCFDCQTQIYGDHTNDGSSLPTCEVCGEQYSDPNGMHTGGTGTGTGSAKCEVCGQPYVSKVPEMPQTADSSSPLLWLASGILSMLGIVLLRKRAYSK